MFCSTCGAEYAQKINYCKRCGSNITTPASTIEVHVPRPRLTGMFFAVAAMGIIGLIACFVAYSEFIHSGIRGPELIVPFIMGLFFIFCIAGGLLWQLARMVSSFQKSLRNTTVEKIAPPLQQPIAIPAQPDTVGSITDHTTRSFDSSVYLEAEKRKRDLA